MATAFKTTIDKIILKQIASRFVPRGRNDGIIKLLVRGLDGGYAATQPPAPQNDMIASS